MGLFRKNPNEVNYPGGKKNIINVIKNTGGPGNLIWRQPEEDFNTNSRVIVMPGETAIFVSRGQIQQEFEPGTYELKTGNYPFLSRLTNSFSGGISSFHCVVWFVSKTVRHQIDWGTGSPIQVTDPVHHLPTKVRAYGTYKVQVENGSLFLEQVVGCDQSLTAADMDDFFFGEVQQYIASAIGGYIMGSGQEILGICANQTMLAEYVKEQLKPVLAENGLKLVSFTIISIQIPMDDPNRQKLADAYSTSESMQVLGDDWSRIQSAEIMKKMAERPVVGLFADERGSFQGMDSMLNHLNSPQSGQTSFAQMQGASAAQMQQMSNMQMQQASATQQDPLSQDADMAALKKLKAMLDMGLIPQSEYDKKMQEILARM